MIGAHLDASAIKPYSRRLQPNRQSLEQCYLLEGCARENRRDGIRGERASRAALEA